MSESQPAEGPSRSTEAPLVYRHAMMIRLTHWLGVICILILLMSGLQIFNAHPALYLGQASDFAHPVASLGVEPRDSREIGVTKIFGYSFDKTGVLGLSGAHDDVIAASDDNMAQPAAMLRRRNIC